MALGIGGNNRVFDGCVAGERRLVKQYFRSSADERDRQGAEWAMLEYARETVPGRAPEPLARDGVDGVSVMSFVEGRRLGETETSADVVMQAAAFFRDLNGPDRFARGAALREASEACFDLESQCRLVQARVDRLAAIDASDAAGRDAARLAGVIRARFETLRAALASRRDLVGIAEPLADDARCVSASDFGFHNALMRDDGALVFLDFEYAGWDDPAKMVGDFFSHPGSPVDEQHLDGFIDVALGGFAAADRLAERAVTMMPLFRLKWCCIMLNEFLSDAGRRRAFANPATRTPQWRQGQIAKVATYLERL